jgi:hypothetical protein
MQLWTPRDSVLLLCQGVTYTRKCWNLCSRTQCVMNTTEGKETSATLLYRVAAVELYMTEKKETRPVPLVAPADKEYKQIDKRSG